MHAAAADGAQVVRAVGQLAVLDEVTVRREAHAGDRRVGQLFGAARSRVVRGEGWGGLRGWLMGWSGGDGLCQDARIMSSGEGGCGRAQ